jgi:hypothetical protein
MIREQAILFVEDNKDMEVIERNGRHEETRTPDLYRVKIPAIARAFDKTVSELLSRL